MLRPLLADTQRHANSHRGPMPDVRGGLFDLRVSGQYRPVGMHLAPPAGAHDTGDSDFGATFTYAARELGKRGLAFLRAREKRAEPRLGLSVPNLVKAAAFGGAYVVNEGFDQAARRPC
jgi:hypothetical protein